MIKHENISFAFVELFTTTPDVYIFPLVFTFKTAELPNIISFDAVDVAPYPIDWLNTLAFKELSVIVKSVWNEMTDDERDGWHLVHGGDWKMRDYPHWELRK